MEPNGFDPTHATYLSESSQASVEFNAPVDCAGDSEVAARGQFGKGLVKQSDDGFDRVLLDSRP